MKAFVGLVGSLLLVIFLVCFGWKWTALQRKYQAHQHPLAQKSGLVVAYQAGSGEAPANSWPAIDRVISHHPEALIWIDLHETKDNVFVLYGADYLDKYANGEGHIWSKTFEEVSQLDHGYRFTTDQTTFPFRDQGIKIRSLEETLARYPQANWVLNNLSNKKDSDESLVKIIKKFEIEKQVIFASPFDVILRSLRTHYPLFMYASGQAELTQLLMVDSIGMAPVSPIKGDILISANPRLTRGFSKELIEEVHRRKKLIIGGMVESTEEQKQMNQMGFDGVITNAPYKLLRSSID